MSMTMIALIVIGILLFGGGIVASLMKVSRGLLKVLFIAAAIVFAAAYFFGVDPLGVM